MGGFKSPSSFDDAMRKLLSLLVLVVLAAGCTSPGSDEVTPTPTPTSPSDPVFPTPTPTPVTPETNETNGTLPDTNETDTDNSTNETPTNTTPVTKRVAWSFNLTIGSSGSGVPVPGTTAGTAEANCVSIPSTHIFRGMANATWNATTNAFGSPATFDLILQGANNTTANATGVSPLNITIPEIPAEGNSTVLVQYTTPPALPTQTAVKMDLWFDMLENATAPTQPVPAACPRVAK